MTRLDQAIWALLAALKERSSLSAAAADLGITQSAATQRLREAERRLGVALARRSGRALALTEAGEIIATAAGAALPALREAEINAIWQGKRSARQLRLAWGRFDTPELAVRLLQACREADPDASVQLIRVAGDGAAAAIAAGEADLGVSPDASAGAGPGAGLGARAIWPDRLAAIFPLGSGPPDGAAASPDAFRSLPYLTYGLRPEPGWEYERFFERGRRFPAEATKIESTELICRLVADGVGASILPEICIRFSASRDRLQVAALAGTPIGFDWALLHAADARAELIDAVARATEGVRAPVTAP